MHFIKFSLKVMCIVVCFAYILPHTIFISDWLSEFTKQNPITGILIFAIVIIFTVDYAIRNMRN